MNDEMVLTVSELSAHIEMLIASDELLSSVRVRGEISNFVHHSSGHMYFTLKDESSCLNAVMFRHANSRLQFQPEDGLSVIVTGSVRTWAPRSQYQIIVRHMTKDGIGDLYRAIEELKEKLRAEGLFDEERKRPLPLLPRRIGVVTSPTGAAIRDILRVLGRRFPEMPVRIYETLVEGPRAVEEIVQAIDRASRDPDIDLLILARGGGSLEELMPFNSEAVARALARCSHPTISAIGHETDLLITDLVADMRAATPSMAAELAVFEKSQKILYLEDIALRMNKAIRKILRDRRETLKGFYYAISPAGLRNRLERLFQLIDDSIRRAETALLRNISKNRERLSLLYSKLQTEKIFSSILKRREYLTSAISSMHRELMKIVHGKRLRLEVASARLEALGPGNVLKRGYALIWNESRNKMMTGVNEGSAGDILKLTFSDGTRKSRLIDETCEVIKEGADRHENKEEFR